jgi:aspartate racemase
MKTIGLIGGMSWESTVTYYQIINQTKKERLGGLHSAKLLLYSVDFAVIEECQAKGAWEESAEILSAAAMKLEGAGADFIVICTNTMHKVLPQIQRQIHIPIIHIADSTADALIDAGISQVALLGTKYTMTQDFYKENLIARGVSVLIPDEEDIELVNRVIYDELCLGVVSDSSRIQYQRIIDEMKGKGARGVILGCTEIGLLIQQEDSSLPVFDTTQIHARAAAMKSVG